ncbi:caspase-2 isoform X2 [Halyomorpha halys]|uniref:caspase-2 isoform X2 n=1 Tax=Halyomorpha halys TaxID=286706 RepID=UPI0006D4F2BB|nr:caspase-2-like isoform X2 [Halyomorpha halys]
MDWNIDTIRKRLQYLVKSEPRGYVLLINNETFRNGMEQRRFGSQRDYSMLKEMWEDFGYQIKEYYNLGLTAFQKAVTDFAKMEEHACVDSAIVFIMSHGKEDESNPRAVKIVTTDDQYISSDWIKEQFSSFNCCRLINKPKVIFFQACRGSLRDRGVVLNIPDMINFTNNSVVPAMTDLLIVFPTLPGYVSQRDTRLGAWFVQECISVFKSEWRKSDLLTMLNKVDQNVREKCERDGDAYFQVVYYESWGFNKKLFFRDKRRKLRRKCESIAPNLDYGPFIMLNSNNMGM